MLSHLFFWFGFQMLFFAAKFYSSAISRHYVSASLWHSGTCLESVTLKISMCKHQTCQAAGCKKTKQTVKEKWQTEQWVCYLIRFLHMNTNNMYASVKIFGTMTFQMTLTVAPRGWVSREADRGPRWQWSELIRPLQAPSSALLEASSSNGITHLNHWPNCWPTLVSNVGIGF